MEQDFTRLRRNVRISAFAALITCGTLTVSSGINDVKAVDFLRIFAAGIAFGALLINLLLLRRSRIK